MRDSAGKSSYKGKGTTYKPRYSSYKPKTSYSSYKPKVAYKPKSTYTPRYNPPGGNTAPKDLGAPITKPGNLVPKALNAPITKPVYNPKNIGQAGPRETSGTSRIGPRYSGPINVGGGYGGGGGYGFSGGGGGGVSPGGAPVITPGGTPATVAPPPITTAPPAPPTTAPGVPAPTTGSWVSRGRPGTYGQYNRQRRMRGPMTGLSITPEMLRRIAMQRFRNG